MDKNILKDEYITLKPCPFCGNSVDYGDRLTKTHYIVTVGCTNHFCFCQVESKVASDSAPHKVVKIFRQMVERWERRV